jgi:hypothetical protein
MEKLKQRGLFQMLDEADLNVRRNHLRATYAVRAVIWYKQETWFLTLKEEHRLRVPENGVLTRIFGLEEGCNNRRLEKIP